MSAFATDNILANNITVNAVIYARYSSDKQNEQSIEGQIRDCTSYADCYGYNIIHTYIDRARTATTDNRPEFQQMIADAKSRQFKYIIVYKLDRFSRNRYDSVFYKHQLKQYGVKVVSATEGINGGDGSENIIMEAVLESMAEIYSKQLRENVMRGMRESASKGNSCGGSVPYGYKIVDKKLVVDDTRAHVVQYVFEQYAAGVSKKAIVDALNNKGCRTAKGKPFGINSLAVMLRNKKYIGIFTYNGMELEGGCPAIIDSRVFGKVQQMLERNKRAPATQKAKVEYILHGKLFCGHCGARMVGESGRGKNGNVYNYYACSDRKKKHTCKKKNERKDYLEWYVVEQALLYVLAPERIEYIAEKVVEAYNREFDGKKISALEQQIKHLDTDLDKAVDTLIQTDRPAAIDRINKKISALEQQQKDLSAELANLRIAAKARLKKEDIIKWLQQFCKGDIMDDDFQRRIIDTFINAVYLFDDRVVIYFNIRGSEQVSYIDMIDELHGLAECDVSDFNCCGSPKHIKSENKVMYIFVRSHIGVIIPRE